jgi:amino acid adenylation domain-containing protein
MITYSEDKAVAATENIQDRDFWLEKLSGELEKAVFNYDFKKNTGDRYKTDTVNFRFTEEIVEKLVQYSRNSDYTLYIILMAGIVALMEKYTGLNDIIIGTPICKQEGEGDYINTVLTIRSILEKGMTVKNLLMSMRQTTLEAADHQNYPIETLLYKLGLEPVDNDFPLFDAAVQLENTHDIDYIKHLNLGIIFSFKRDQEGVGGTIIFNSELYKKSTIEKIAEHTINFFREALFDLDKPLPEIDILSGDERKRVLFNYNNTEKEFPRTLCYHHLFEEQVLKTPEKIAARYNERTATYSELNKNANRISRYLKEKGVRAGDFVSIYMKRSIKMLTAIIGAFKAGAAYVPIDVDYPEERIQYIVENSCSKIIITENTYETKVNAMVKKLPDCADPLTLDREGSIPLTLSRYADDNPGFESTPDTLAYMIYTSGTTGKPKGTMIHQQGMINHLYAKINDLNITADDITAQTASACFDISVWQFLVGLVVGAHVHIVDRERVLDPQQLLPLLKNGRITILEMVPSMMTAFLRYVDQEEGCALDDLKWMIATGEALSPALIREWCSRYPDIPLVNAYGPTEASDDITHYIVPPNWDNRQQTVPIGKPVQNMKIYILDKHMQLCPIGVKGEICVAGVGIGKGYHRDPEKTAKAFITNPFAGETNSSDYNLLYRTGDIGSFDQEGNILFFGRMDHQVKIRGYRIELGEIENKLLEHKSVSEAVVLVINTAGNDSNTGNYLCAYLVAGEEVTRSQLKEWLLNHLPDYMVPSAFVMLEQMPVNPSGKIDRKALPEPEFEASENFIPPGNEVEHKLADIWADILGLEKSIISIDTNFFEFGGHSLNATQMVSKIHKELNVKVPLGEIFKTPTIRGLARYISKGIKECYISIEPVEKKEYYILSSAQKRLFILQQMNLENTAYNAPLVINLKEKPEKKRLEDTFRKLITRHESLRTSFEIIDGEPVQRVHDDVKFRLEQYKTEPGEVQRFIKEFVRPFDLSEAPLVRGGVIDIGKDECILVFDIHHIISDGVSDDILREDYTALYENKELPPLNLQYKDFAQWQNSLKEKNKIKKQEEFWLTQFQGEIPRLNLRTDYPGSAVHDFEGKNLKFKLGKEETETLNKIALEHGSTLFMVLLSIYYIFLAKMSGQEDIIIGTSLAGRGHEDLEPIIGMFVNTLALRNYPEGGKTFISFLKEVKERVLEAYENQDYPFEELVDKLPMGRSDRRNPLFDIMFALQNYDMGESGTSSPDNDTETERETPSQTAYNYENKTAKFDIMLVATEKEGEIFFLYQYRTGLFKQETIEKHILYLEYVIKTVIENPHEKISKMELISEADRIRLMKKIKEQEAWEETADETGFSSVEIPTEKPGKIAADFDY